MPETAVAIPRTLEERLSYGETMIVEASWDTFLNLLEEGNYPVQYDEGQILSFMGYETQEHEELVMRIGHLLITLLEGKPYRFFGSNLALVPPGKAKSYFNADCTIVKGELRHEPLVRLVRNSTAYFTLGRPGFTGFLRLIISETLH